MRWPIKSCPFCGGYSKLEPKSKTVISGELAYVTYVRYTKCNSHGRRFRLNDNEDVQIPRKKAIDAWNRRVKYVYNI